MVVAQRLRGLRGTGSGPARVCNSSIAPGFTHCARKSGTHNDRGKSVLARSQLTQPEQRTACLPSLSLSPAQPQPRPPPAPATPHSHSLTLTHHSHTLGIALSPTSSHILITLCPVIPLGSTTDSCSRIQHKAPPHPPHLSIPSDHPTYVPLTQHFLALASSGQAAGLPSSRKPLRRQPVPVCLRLHHHTPPRALVEKH